MVLTQKEIDPVEDPIQDPIRASIRRGLDFLVASQGPDGSWRGDYGGPMFLLPMYIAACHISKQPIEKARKDDMVAYMRRVQNPDGSIGLHVEDSGSMFATVLCYVALRILGVEPDDSDLVRMRSWIMANGTALGAASWGKFTLARFL